MRFVAKIVTLPVRNDYILYDYGFQTRALQYAHPPQGGVRDADARARRDVCLRTYGLRRSAFGSRPSGRDLRPAVPLPQSLGYKVRYVRNITDVGHLEHDADEGEDKIAKKARLEQLEPMEVAHYYTERYHRAMDALTSRPLDRAHASGHIIEQIAFVQRILDDGFAYVSNRLGLFRRGEIQCQYHYGRLSGRNLEDIVANTRELDGQSDKRHSYDFALWKKAAPEHIMHWPRRGARASPAGTWSARR